MKALFSKGKMAVAAAAAMLSLGASAAYAETPVVVRSKEGVDCVSRRLRRQQLARHHHGFRKGRGPEMPEHHSVRIC